jgi:AcrR family transcriptional regulator
MLQRAIVNDVPARTTRSNGRASRREILDAAAEIASEYGFQGTTISAVSKRSGLPASSIYWHFENKEALFTAVIDDSYERWRAELVEPHHQPDRASGRPFERMYARLGQFPDFLRLGLMITLERAPEGAHAARQRFEEIRQESLLALGDSLVAQYHGLTATQAKSLAAITLALIDGSFIAAFAGETTLTPRQLSNTVHTLALSMSSDEPPRAVGKKKQ